MKISNIRVDIKEKDLFDIITEVINEYIEMKEITLLSLMIDENIFLEGVFKNKLSIKFSIKLSLNGLENNVLQLNIDSIKCMNIRIGKLLIRTMFRILLKKYEKLGLSMEDGKLIIDMNKLMPVIPFVNFTLEDIQFAKGEVITSINNLSYLKDKQGVQIEDIINANDNNLQEVENHLTLDGDETSREVDEIKSDGYVVEDTCATTSKVSDAYSGIRRTTEEVIESKFEGVAKYALLLPDLLALVVRLFKDKRVKKKDKIIAGIMLTYVAVPIDIIPESIPVLGKMDDIILLFIGLDYLLNSVDEKIIRENWEGDEDIAILIKSGVSYVSELSFGGKVKNLINIISR